MESKLHNLKTLQPYFYDLEMGIKTFDLRKDDRDFRLGDSVCLQEYKNDSLSGKWFVRRIVYVLRDCPEFGLKEGYVILGLK